MIDYLQKGQAINGDYHASILRQLKEAIKSKRRGKPCAGVLLLQGNAIVYTVKWQSQKRKDAALNCSLMHLILQIWHHQTSTYSPN